MLLEGRNSSWQKLLVLQHVACKMAALSSWCALRAAVPAHAVDVLHHDASSALAEQGCVGADPAAG